MVQAVLSSLELANSVYVFYIDMFYWMFDFNEFCLINCIVGFNIVCQLQGPSGKEMTQML